MARLLTALIASSLLAACTLLVDGRLEQSADMDAAVDAASPGDEDAGDQPEDGASADDTSTGSERSRDGDGSAGEHDAAGPAASPDAGDRASADGAADPDSAQPGEPGEVEACAGHDHACALDKAGNAVCWGANEEDQGKLPSGRAYRRVACGDYHTCALDSAGSLVCVGRNRDGQRVSEPGPFEEVAAGDAHSCVLDAAGSARCFGQNTGGQGTPPGLPLRSLTAGGGFTCAIRRTDSRVQCWGFGAADLTNAVADTAFASIDAARDYVCGVTDAGAVRCWSRNAPPAPDRALKVSAGQFGACALLIDRSVRCWNGSNVATPHADKGPFRDVVVGGTGRCLVPVQGALLCEPGPPTSALAPGPANLD